MDVLNIISWLKSKRQVTTVDASQTLIPLGIKDSRRDDGYLPSVISVADLATAVAPSLYDANGNTFAGLTALASTTGYANTAFGEFALSNATIPDLNVAIGASAMEYMVTGANNTAIGARALQWSTNGVNNTAVGLNALRNVSTGSYNTSLGTNSLNGISTGSYNIAIGNQAGGTNNTASNNIIIGADANSGNFSSSIILGRSATATASNQFVVGSSAYNAGAIATEALTPTVSWTVKINGVDYKIPLQIA